MQEQHLLTAVGMESWLGGAGSEQMTITTQNAGWQRVLLRQRLLQQFPLKLLPINRPKTASLVHPFLPILRTKQAVEVNAWYPL
jgi:hypothetical protein